jgi:hypothetical protein
MGMKKERKMKLEGRKETKRKRRKGRMREREGWKGRWLLGGTKIRECAWKNNSRGEDEGGGSLARFLS